MHQRKAQPMPQVANASADSHENNRAIGRESRPALDKRMWGGRERGEGVCKIELCQHLPICGAVNPDVSGRGKWEENCVGEWMKGCSTGFSASGDADISDHSK